MSVVMLTSTSVAVDVQQAGLPIGLLVWLLMQNEHDVQQLSVAQFLRVSATVIYGVLLFLWALVGDPTQLDGLYVVLVSTAVTVGVWMLPSALARWAEHGGHRLASTLNARWLDARWGPDPVAGAHIAAHLSHPSAAERADLKFTSLDERTDTSRATLLALAFDDVPHADRDRWRAAMELVLLHPAQGDQRAGALALDWLLLDAVDQGSLGRLRRYARAELSGCLLGRRKWTGAHTPIAELQEKYDRDPWLLVDKESVVRLANSPLRRQLQHAVQHGPTKADLSDEVRIEVGRLLANDVVLDEALHPDRPRRQAVGLDDSLACIGQRLDVDVPEGMRDNVGIFVRHLAREVGVGDNDASDVLDDVLALWDDASSPGDNARFDPGDASLRQLEQLRTIAARMPQVPPPEDKGAAFALFRSSKTVPLPLRDIFKCWVQLHACLQSIHDVDDRLEGWNIVHYAVSVAAVDLWNLHGVRQLPTAMFTYIVMGGIAHGVPDHVETNLSNLR